MTCTQLFVDGGCVSRNPSPLGITFAWVQISELNERIKSGSGLVTPEEIGEKTLSNNFAELLAAVRGLESLPDGWHGSVYTDSKVTLLRLTKNCKFRNVPDWLIRRTNELKQKRRWRAVLVRGHASETELLNGWSNGRPTSRWNDFCDKQCTKLAREFLKKLGKTIG